MPQQPVIDVMLILERDGTVCLAERQGTGYADGMLNLPSGKLDDGEDVFEAVIREGLSLHPSLPPPGQGALALQTREGESAAWVAALDHPMTALAVAAERGAMTALEGSCRTAIGAHAEIGEGHLRLTTEMLAPDGSVRWRRSGEIGDVHAADAQDEARALGLRLGAEVHAAGGDQRIET